MARQKDAFPYGERRRHDNHRVDPARRRIALASIFITIFWSSPSRGTFWDALLRCLDPRNL